MRTEREHFCLSSPNRMTPYCDDCRKCKWMNERCLWSWNCHCSFNHLSFGTFDPQKSQHPILLSLIEKLWEGERLYGKRFKNRKQEWNQFMDQTVQEIKSRNCLAHEMSRSETIDARSSLIYRSHKRTTPNYIILLTMSSSELSEKKKSQFPSGMTN